MLLGFIPHSPHFNIICLLSMKRRKPSRRGASDAGAVPCVRVQKDLAKSLTFVADNIIY